tara:strand:- start:181 stop:864 length:684 start_codon:yes stop_codon:yes gene_type:complete
MGIEGVGVDLEHRILTRLVVELARLNILASYSSSGGGTLLLYGKLVTSDDSGGHINWRILDSSGDVVAMFEQKGYSHREQSDVLVGNAALRIQSLLSDQPEKPVEALVFVPPVDGAPGDGRTSLTNAVRSSLVALKITVVRELMTDAVILLGSVATTKRDDSQLVEIHWSLISNDGEEIAVVTQSDLVPVGILDGAWGELAEIIAEAVSPSLASLIRDYSRNVEENP